MTNVVTIKNSADPLCVGILRDLLALAERGEIVSVTVVAEHVGGVCGTHWGGRADLMMHVAQAARMQHVLQKRLDEPA